MAEPAQVWMNFDKVRRSILDCTVAYLSVVGVWIFGPFFYFQNFLETTLKKEKIVNKLLQSFQQRVMNKQIPTLPNINNSNSYCIKRRRKEYQGIWRMYIMLFEFFYLFSLCSNVGKFVCWYFPLYYHSLIARPLSSFSHGCIKFYQ